MSRNLGWKLIGAGLLAGGVYINDKATAEPAPAPAATSAATSALVCAVEKNTLIIKEAGANGALRASLDEDGTVKGKTVSGRGMIYDPKDDTKAITTGVNFKADFTTGSCTAGIIGDVLGSRTLTGRMQPGTTYSPAKLTFQP